MMTTLSRSWRGPPDHHNGAMNLGMKNVAIQKITAATFTPGRASVINTKINVVTMAATGKRNPSPNCYRPSWPNDGCSADVTRARAGRGPLQHTC
jgi:hypothetical protein